MTTKKYLTQKHKDAISKGLTGYKQTDEHKQHTGEANTGEKSGMWKGDDAGIKAIHRWVERQVGKANLYTCVECGNPALDWSNIDHKYRRVVEDYKPKCRSCHMKYDFKFNLVVRVKCTFRNTQTTQLTTS